MTPAIRIATRGSALARWQAERVAALLREAAVAPSGSGPATPIDVELVVLDTTADVRLDIPIWEMGGKGVFVKEIQAAVLDGRADLAVHSAKDLPALTPDELVLAAVPERADPRDVLVGHAALADLPAGAPVATGSLRRQVQLAHRRPDLVFEGLRGNIATRLSKVPAGGAIVMAAAAIDRLGLGPELAAGGLVADVLDPDVVLPQVGQGALAVECRADADAGVRALLAAITHEPTATALAHERAFLLELGGDCSLPAGAHATLLDGGTRVRLDGVLASPDHTRLERASLTRDTDAPDFGALGADLARSLLSRL